MNREKEGLQQLGKKTEYRMDYAPEVLETFQNKHPENDYWVQFNCPEFTSLCPITGQPDFAEIKIMYIPGERMVESKSLSRGLCECDHEGSCETHGSEVHRGDWPVHATWGNQYLSLCQLRSPRYEIRDSCRTTVDESYVLKYSPAKKYKICRAFCRYMGNICYFCIQILQ